MSYKEEAPTMTVRDYAGNRTEERYDHPAYGKVVLTHVQGGSGALFGSEIGHLGRMRIEVSRAHLDRHLNHDWIHSAGGLPLIVFEMSHSQFAEFITGVGKGDGTPCTLRYASSGPVEDIPGIKPIETKHEMFTREIKDAAKEHLDSLSEQVTKLQEVIDSGKLPKAELREIAKELRRHVDQTPGTMKYVVDQAQEALEKATTNAKIEVEAYVSQTAKRLGLENIQQLAQLGHDKE